MLPLNHKASKFRTFVVVVAVATLLLRAAARRMDLITEMLQAASSSGMPSRKSARSVVIARGALEDRP